jgi:hypothetical protein
MGSKRANHSRPARAKTARAGYPAEAVIMDAKWNSVIDNMAVRIGLVVVGFSVWLALGYSLLSA